MTKKFQIRVILPSVLSAVLTLLLLFFLPGCAKNPFYNTDTTKKVTYFHPNFAPDGRVVAFRYEAFYDSSGFVGGGDLIEDYEYIVLIDTVNTQNEEVLGETEAGHNVSNALIEFSSSMKYVAVNGYYVYQVNPWKKICTLNIGTSGMKDFDWSSDETEIAAIDVSYNIRIYDAMNGTLKRVINQEKAYGLCWKYKERIALTGENYLWFIKSDGTGYVTANFDVPADVYDKTEDYLYSYLGGLNQVKLKLQTTIIPENELLNQFEYSNSYWLLAISNNGQQFVYCAAASEWAGIYIGKSDGSDQIIELR